MVINGTKRVGDYRSMRTRPLSVEFLYKGDAEYILKNQKYLNEIVFVDQEYCKETEESRRILHSYWKADRKLSKYHRKCRLDGNMLILKGLSYMKNAIHKLPKEPSGFNVSSKSDGNGQVVGFFRNMNPVSNFYPAKFHHNGFEYH